MRKELGDTYFPGSFSNEDDHHIENINKATGFDKYIVLTSHCMTATWKCLISCVMEEIKFNNQQHFFLSEYCPQEINSREIYPHSTFSSKRNKIIINVPKFEKMQIHFQGLHVVSWILEKVLKFVKNFPELVKVW